MVTVTSTCADVWAEAVATTRTVCAPPSSATPVTADGGLPPSSKLKVIVGDCPPAGGAADNKPPTNPNAKNHAAARRITASSHQPSPRPPGPAMGPHKAHFQKRYPPPPICQVNPLRPAGGLSRSGDQARGGA